MTGTKESLQDGYESNLEMSNASWNQKEIKVPIYYVYTNFNLESNSKGPDSIERARLRAKESLEIVRKLMEEGKEQIEDIRTEALESEQKHRTDHQKKKEERSAKRANAKEHSDTANTQILSTWEKEKDAKKNHEELIVLLKELKSMCDDVVNYKDKVIKDFQQDIKVKEDEYFKSLSKQADDIGKEAPNLLLNY